MRSFQILKLAKFLSLLMVTIFFTNCKVGKENKLDNITDSVCHRIDFSLTEFPQDSNTIIIVKESDLGDLEKFQFKYFKTMGHCNNPFDNHVLATYTVCKKSENKYSIYEYNDSMKPLFYSAYAFMISKEEWTDIKTKLNLISSNIDSTKINSFCEFCTSYILVYKDKIIEDKLTKDKKQVQILFEYLIKTYQGNLYKARKNN